MSDTPKRKHRATGKPVGGARAGAGRRPGGINALPIGAVRAIHACKLRIPDGTSPEAETIATRALQRVIDVMEEKVKWGAGDVLRAAALVRNEVCGPVEQRVHHRAEVSIQVVDPYAEPKE